MFRFFKTIPTVLGANSLVGGAKDHLNNLPGANTGDSGASIASGVVNYALYVAGILAVVMIIVSGVQMTTSAGDPGKVAKAKNTMVYSIVGLIIAILAFAIVNFVINKTTSGGGGGSSNFVVEDVDSDEIWPNS